MKAFIVFALIAAASAASVTNDKEVPILRQDVDVGVDGSWHSSFETGNGIAIEERGVLKNVGQKEEAQEVVGQASWTAPDGQPIQLTWLANENGFQPQGAHLPVAPVDDNTPPPIPAAIIRSLEWNAAHPQKEESVKGGRPLL